MEEEFAGTFKVPGHIMANACQYPGKDMVDYYGDWDLFHASKEDEANYYGSWMTGLGFQEVKVPKENARPLTKAEIDEYNGKPRYINSTPIAPIIIKGYTEQGIESPEPPDDPRRPDRLGDRRTGMTPARRKAMIRVLSTASEAVMNYEMFEREKDKALDWAARRLSEELHGRLSALQNEERIAKIDAEEDEAACE